MPLRLIRSLAITAAAAGAAAVPAGVISAEIVRLLVTFLGLIAAGVLPSVTLVVNSMTSGGRSVARVDSLHRELARVLRQLYRVFLWLLAAFVLLALLSALPQLALLTSESGVPDLGCILVAGVQGAAGGVFAKAILEALVIPQALSRSLDIRTDMARAAAADEVRKNAPTDAEVNRAFATAPTHGRRVSLEELHRR